MNIKAPRADKNLGQHYLTNTGAIEKICTPPEGCSFILEIGPGPGTLTKKLTLLPQRLEVVEKDRRFRENLLELMEEEQIHFQDALGFNYQDLPVDTWIVSNLPYNISVPLTLAFSQAQNVKWMSLMFQKEVAEKFLPPEDKKNPSSSLSCLFQTYFTVKKLINLKPGSFSPPPKVESTVLLFERKQTVEVAPEDFREFEKFLRALFQFKRKQIGKIMRGFSKSNIDELLASQQIPTNARAEGLNLQQIQKLFHAWRLSGK
jgi:16S rRNA (adenine1518-N6/adenine1519-N6)-dimethyltransferase